MTERKKLELVECNALYARNFFTGERGELKEFSNKEFYEHECQVQVPGIWLNTTKRDLLDAFHEVYLQGQRDRENGVLHAPNLFNILGLKE